MRFLRFLIREFIVHGIVFAVAGTLVLSAFYLLSIGAPAESYAEAARVKLSHREQPSPYR